MISTADPLLQIACHTSVNVLHDNRLQGAHQWLTEAYFPRSCPLTRSHRRWWTGLLLLFITNASPSLFSLLLHWVGFLLLFFLFLLVLWELLPFPSACVFLVHSLWQLSEVEGPCNQINVHGYSTYQVHTMEQMTVKECWEVFVMQFFLVKSIRKSVCLHVLIKNVWLLLTGWIYTLLLAAEWSALVAVNTHSFITMKELASENMWEDNAMQAHTRGNKDGICMFQRHRTGKPDCEQNKIWESDRPWGCCAASSGRGSGSWWSPWTQSSRTVWCALTALSPASREGRRELSSVALCSSCDSCPAQTQARRRSELSNATWMTTTVMISLIMINVMVFLFFSDFWCDCLGKYYYRVSVIPGLMKQPLIILISHLKKSKLIVR